MRESWRNQLQTREKKSVKTLASNFSSLLARQAGFPSSDVLHSSLQASGGMQNVCGYVFKDGDLCYNCKQCQADPTCVMCQKCFLACKASHTGHEVTFHRAGPGGCCDCGDLEAWAQEGCCPEHGKSKISGDESEEISMAEALLPTELLNALRAATAEIFLALHCLCARLASARGRKMDSRGNAPPKPTALAFFGEGVTPGLQSELPQREKKRSSYLLVRSGEYPVAGSGSGSGGGGGGGTDEAEPMASSATGPPSSSWQLLLHNDDIHTYQEVTSSLHFAGWTKEEAHSLTVKVDKEGYAVAFKGTGLDVEKVFSSMENFWKAWSFPLDFSIEDSQLSALRHVCGPAVSWLTRLARTSNLVAAVIAGVLLSEEFSWEGQLMKVNDGLGKMNDGSLSMSASGEGGGGGEVQCEGGDAVSPLLRLQSLLLHGVHAGAVGMDLAAVVRSTTIAPSPTKIQPLLVDLCRYDSFLPPEFRSGLHDLFLALFRFPSFRTTFGCSYIAAYPDIWKRYSAQKGVEALKLEDLSVQLLTVPSVVGNAERLGLLPATYSSGLYESLAFDARRFPGKSLGGGGVGGHWKAAASPAAPAAGGLLFPRLLGSSPAARLEANPLLSLRNENLSARIFEYLGEVRHVFSPHPVEPLLRHAPSFHAFCRGLLAVSGCAPQVRQRYTHVLFEDESFQSWVNPLSLVSSLTGVVTSIFSRAQLALLPLPHHSHPPGSGGLTLHHHHPSRGRVQHQARLEARLLIDPNSTTTSRSSSSK